MPSNKKLLQAAAGSAGGDNLYVEDVFSTYLYTGNGTGQTITNDIDLSGEGGLVWMKDRTTGSASVGWNTLVDTERGGANQIWSNSTNGQVNLPSRALTFNSNGFSVSADIYHTNRSGDDFASWSFRKAEKFFDVVTYTGTGVDPMSVPHNLGVTPGCVIIKRTDTTADWQVMFPGLIADGYGGTGRMRLNTTAAYAATGWTSIADSTHITIPTNLAEINASGGTYVAYLFASDAGGFGDDDESIIKCGSYTGNGGSQEINLGFEPQFLIIKNASSSSNWMIMDNMRGLGTTFDRGYGTEAVNAQLRANTSGAESNSSAAVAITSTGFETFNGNGEVNGNGNTLIYIAIRRPMKAPESGTEVFKGVTRTGNASNFSVDSFGFAGDLMISSIRNTAGYGSYFFQRLLGSQYLRPYGSNAEASGATSLSSWDMEGFSGLGNGGLTNDNNVTYVYNMFKRATGFFDVVAYSGTGSAHAEDHNLGVAPEMMIIKPRNLSYQWSVWHKDIASTSPYYEIVLNSSNAQTDADDTNSPFAGVPTSTGIPLPSGTASASNRSGYNYIAYLFATLDGVSKVGSYTGTGSNVNVDCGFSAGARFILIKRTDSTGDWYVWDSERGIVAGNDPYLLLNSTAAEVTNTDYIDPLNAGFTVTSSAPAGLNASGGTYIFLAIS